MPRSERDKKDAERSNAQDLADRIRRHKLQKEQEEDEKEDEKRRRKVQEQENEEDDENLREDEEEQREDKRRENRNRKKENKDKDKKDNEGEEKDTSSNDDNSSKLQKSDKTENVKDSNKDIDQPIDDIKMNSDSANSNIKSNATKGANEKLDTDINTGAKNTGEATKKAGEKATGQVAEEAERAELSKALGSIDKGIASTGTTSAGTAAGTGATSAGTAGGTAAGTGATSAGTAGASAAGAGAGAGGTGTAVATAAGAKVASEAAAGAGTAGATAAGAGAAGAGIGIFGIVLIIILILIVVIGIIFFFITMPGMVVGKIGDAINSFRENVEAFMDGNNAAKIFVNREQVLGAAEYLNQMGYDLDGFGFLDDEVTKKMTAEYNEGTWASLKDWWSSIDESDSSNLPLKNFNTKSIQERKEENSNGKYQEVYLDKYDSSYNDSDIRNHILLAKDADGDITFAKSKYLATYLSAENAIYLLRNDNTDIFNRAAKRIGMNDTSRGSGLTYFINASDRNIADYVVNSSNINFKDPEGWFGYNRVNIFKASRTMVIKNADDGWFKSSNYTYSLDGWASRYGVPLQLSLALHLSSLAPDFALDVATRGTEDTTVEMGLVESENVNTKAVLYLDIGNGKQYYKIEKSESQYRLIKADGSVAIFEGTDTNGYFETGEDKTPTVISNAFGGNLATNEIGTFFDDVIDLDIDTEDFTKYIPIILSVKNHWYQDLDFKGCYEYTGTSDVNYMKYTINSDDSDILQKASDTIYVEETSLEGTIQQIAEPKIVGEPGEWIKELIDNNEYFKYDGTRKSDEPSKINFTDTAVDAIAMLEQIQGEDSQDIIRMFRELMASYDITFEEAEGTKLKKELFANIIRNYSGELLTDGEDCVYKANIPPTQTGFEEGLTVQASCKGKITYITKDAVCIEIDEPSKDYNKYTILISGFKVDETLGELQFVKEGIKLGETIKQDLKLVLRDENGAIVKNKYVVATFDDDSGNGSSTSLDSQTAQMYNMTAEQLDVLQACVRQEAGSSYKSNLAVMSCIMNRVKSGKNGWGNFGKNPYSQVTAPGQFTYSIDNLWKRYLHGNVPATTKKAVREGLQGKTIHKYYSFRTDSSQARRDHPNGEVIGGNWFFK